jgi:selenocysteine-specific elongation factor
VLEEVLAHTLSRSAAQGVPRLPIDRVFTVGGFGTVVTGTLSDGPLAIGQEIEIQPRGLRGRVRGLQTHGAKQEHALPGTRVALNIAGVAVDSIARGDVVTLPDHLVPTTLLDLKLQLVRDAPHVLHQNALLDLFVYSAETPCHVTLLDAEQLGPGDTGWVQLRLERPIAVQRGDRCIVRMPSPSVTIGGGVVVDARPHRHRRFRAAVLDALEAQRRGTPADLLLHALGAAPTEWTQTVRVSGLTLPTVLAAWTELRSMERVVNLDGDDLPDPRAWVMTTDAWRALLHTMITTVGAYHERWPLRAGISREELKSKLHLPSARAFDGVLRRAEGEKHLVAAGAHVHLPAWTPQPTAEQLRHATTLLEHLRATPFMPPPKAEWEGFGGELITFLAERGEIVRVSADVIFAAEAYQHMIAWTVETLSTAGEVGVAQLRDRFGTSRKYALALLEHLDERRITRRRGDVRVKY